MYNRKFITAILYVVSTFVIYLELYLFRLMLVIFSIVYELSYAPSELKSSWMAHFVMMVCFVMGYEVLRSLIEYGDHLEKIEGVEVWTKKKKASDGV